MARQAAHAVARRPGIEAPDGGEHVSIPAGDFLPLDSALAPDCSRVELAALPKDRDERKLLRAMGQETADVHLGNGSAKAAIQKDFQQRHGHWLRKAAEAMTDATEEDWKQWRKG